MTEKGTYTPYWQGGLTNAELAQWWRLKTKAEPTDRDMSCFALGVEVGCGTNPAPKPGDLGRTIPSEDAPAAWVRYFQSGEDDWDAQTIVGATHPNELGVPALHFDDWEPLYSRPAAPAPAPETTVTERITSAALKRAMGHPVVLEIMADCVSCADTENYAMSDPEFAAHDSAPYRLVEADLRCQAAAIRAEDPEIWPSLEFSSPAVKAEPSPTAGMTLAQRILHVGGRNNAAGYVEFGSTQAVEALIRQVLRDLPTQAPPGFVLVESPITEEMHRAACKVLLRASGLDGTPQRMLDALAAIAREAHVPVQGKEVTNG